MGDDDTAEMDAAIARTVAPINRLLDKMLTADGMLITVQKDVAVIKNEQKTQGRELGALKKRVDDLSTSLHEKVNKMPDRWRLEIKESVAEHKKQDEITGVHDLPKQQWNQQTYSTPPGLRRNNGVRVSRRTLITIGKIIGWIVLGIGATYGLFRLPGLWPGP